MRWVLFAGNLSEWIKEKKDFIRWHKLQTWGFKLHDSSKYWTKSVGKWQKTRPLALCGNVGPFIYSYLMKLLFINMFWRPSDDH